MTQGEPGFGQQGQYGQPQGGYPPPAANPYGAPASGRRTFGSVGAIVAAIGVVAVVLAFTVFNWFTGGTSHFSDVKKLVDAADKAGVGFKPSTLYYDWLAWVLLVAAVLTALLAVLPIVASRVWQVVGLVVGLVGAGLTFLAIKLEDAPGAKSYNDFLKHTDVAFYLAAGGFVVIGIGAAIGSRRN